MTVKVTDWNAFKAIRDLRNDLAAISESDGYNTRPTLLTSHLSEDEVPNSTFPAIYPELVTARDITTKLGPGQAFTEDMEIVLVIWGYVYEPGDMQEALLALLIDILSAMWDVDETRADAAILTNLHGVDFVESFTSHDNIGALVVEIGIPFQTERG